MAHLTLLKLWSERSEGVIEQDKLISDSVGLSREISLVLILMLPRHARRIVLSSLPKTATNQLITARLTARHPERLITAHGFHSTSQRKNELPKSPFQTFVEVLKEEIQKNRQLQDNMKQLSGDVDRFQDSEALKKSRELYERARVRLQLCGPRELSH